MSDTMLRYLLTLWMICFSSSVFSVEKNETLIFAYGKHDAPPHAFISTEPPRQIYGGIMYDIGQEIGKRLGVRVKFVKVPRGRLVSWLIAGRVDAQCQLNPGWVDDHQQLYWTRALFSSADRFYTSEEINDSIHQHSDLKGLRVGGLRSYTYSHPFTDLVNKGDVLRVNASSAQQLQQMLQLKRIDAMLVDEIAAQYLLSLAPHSLAATTLEDGRQDRHCTYSKLSSIPFTRFNLVIDAMLDDGTVQTIMQKYQ